VCLAEFVFMPPGSVETWRKKLGEKLFNYCVQKLNGWIGAERPIKDERPTALFLKRVKNGRNATNTFAAWVVKAGKEDFLRLESEQQRLNNAEAAGQDAEARRLRNFGG
jgi:hypothetical protein